MKDKEMISFSPNTKLMQNPLIVFTNFHNLNMLGVVIEEKIQ